MSQSQSSSQSHQGKAAPPASKRVKIHEPDSERQFTVEDLKKYDGKDPTSPIYLALKGVVYDVTASEGFYGPDGAYGVFSGRDASRGLAKMDLKEQATNITDLSPAELQTLNEWVERFNVKYQVVGKLSK
jgi:membrane-associated progesterone receptor component